MSEKAARVGKGLNELLVRCGLDEAARRKRIQLRENQLRTEQESRSRSRSRQIASTTMISHPKIYARPSENFYCTIFFLFFRFVPRLSNLSPSFTPTLLFSCLHSFEKSCHMAPLDIDVDRAYQTNLVVSSALTPQLTRAPSNLLLLP